MTSLFTNIRFYVLLFSFFLSIVIYIYYTVIFEDESQQLIGLTQAYALTAISFLYLALLAGPFCYVFKGFPFRAQYLKARRAIGVSAFYFSTLHASLSFFGLLGGFGGLGFLSAKYLLAIGLSFTGLIILSLMAATSFDFVIEKMTFRRWKILHRLVYIGSFFILIHALLLGSHFADISDLIPQVFLGAIAFLVFLESLRFDAFLHKKFINFPKFGITATIIVGFIIFLLVQLFRTI